MPLAGFEPAIPAIERLQTYALDRTATGTGWEIHYYTLFQSPELNVVNITFILTLRAFAMLLLLIVVNLKHTVLGWPLII